MKTAGQLNGALLIAAIFGLIFGFFEFKGWDLFWFIIAQSVIIGLIITALASESLKYQKIFGIIPYLLVFIEAILIIYNEYNLAEIHNFYPYDYYQVNHGLVKGLMVTATICIIGIYKLIRADE